MRTSVFDYDYQYEEDNDRWRRYLSYITEAVVSCGNGIKKAITLGFLRRNNESRLLDVVK